MPPGQVADHSLVRRVVGPLAAVPVAIADSYRLLISIEQGPAGPGRQLAPGRVHVDTEVLAYGFQQSPKVVGDIATAPWRDRALGEREVGIGDDELGINLAPRAQATAFRACTEGRIEREAARLELLEAQSISRAGEMLAEHAHAPGIVVIEVDKVENHQARPESQRRLDGVG